MKACRRGQPATVALLSLLFAACAAPTGPVVGTDDDDPIVEPDERNETATQSPIGQAHPWGAAPLEPTQKTPKPQSDPAISFGKGCEQTKWSTDLPSLAIDGPVSGYTIAARSDRGFVVSGTFEGAISVQNEVFESHGDADIFVLAFAASGELLWGHAYGGSFDDDIFRVRVDGEDNVLLAGRRSPTSVGVAAYPGPRESFVTKLDSKGVELWSHSLGQSTSGMSLAIGPHDEIVVAGSANQPFAIGDAELMGPYVLAMNSAGHPRWLRDMHATDLAIDAHGEIYAAAHGLAKLDAKGGLLWERDFGDDLLEVMVRVTSEGGAVVAGKLVGTADLGGGPLTSQGTRDVVVGELSAKGEHVWSKRFGALGNQWTTGLAVDPHDRVVLTGTTSGWVDFGGGEIVGPKEKRFLVILDRDGGHICSTALDPGLTETMAADQLATDSDGRPMLTGAFIGDFDVDESNTLSSEQATGFVLRY